MAFANPRRHHHRRRHNPRRHHHRRNPFGQTAGVLLMHPFDAVTHGLMGALSAYLTISIPNSFGFGFPGTDIFSRLERLAARMLTGGLLYSFVGRMLPGYAPAILAGAGMGSAGAAVFDFMGASVVLGAGDSSQTSLIPSFTSPSLSGFAAYAAARPFGMGRLPLGRQPAFGGLAAYRAGGFRGIHGPGSRGVVPMSIYP